MSAAFQFDSRARRFNYRAPVNLTLSTADMHQPLPQGMRWDVARPVVAIKYAAGRRPEG